MENPWHTLDSRYAYRNPWLAVREDRVTRPDGQPGLYGVVESPPFVVVAALTEDGRIWLLRQWRYTIQRVSVEIVAGTVLPGEELGAAARRELREEVGLTAGRLDPIGAFYMMNGFCSAQGHFFVARDLVPGVAAPDPTERIEPLCVPFAQAMAWLWDGTIDDGITALPLHRLAYMLQHALLP